MGIAIPGSVRTERIAEQQKIRTEDNQSMDTLSTMVATLRKLRNARNRADGSKAVAEASIKVDAHVAKMYAAGFKVVDGIWQ